MTTTPDIFISYSREDQAVARRFADALKAEGFDVWWDTELRPGESFDAVIEQALRAAKAVVVLWSPRSVASRWVRAEATLADRLKTLVPVIIEPCDLPIIFELTHTAQLGNWTGTETHAGWTAFLADMKRFVAREAAPSVEAPTLEPVSVEATLKPGQSGSAPSLAVLPFTNRSPLAEDEVFAEGMVEDVISALSQGVNVRVLGSTATANLSRAAITDLAAVGRQLGVRYLLEGNVRRVGPNLRVTTQLLEAATSEVVWSGKFDRPLVELAELQEELVTDIAASLDTQVYSLEMERALRKPDDLTAWEAVARAISVYRHTDTASLVRASEEAARAARIAPDYGPALAIHASSLATIYLFTSPDDPVEVARIRSMAERALALAPDDVSVLSLVGSALCYLGLPEVALPHLERAVRKAPGHGMAYFHLSFACNMLNRHEKALSQLDMAERLMPGAPLMHLIKHCQSNVLIALGRWAEGEAALDDSIALNPAQGISYANKALYCVRLGREAEAPRHINTARQLGLDLAAVEQMFRRTTPTRATLEADLTTFRALYAATEPGA